MISERLIKKQLCYLNNLTREIIFKINNWHCTSYLKQKMNPNNFVTLVVSSFSVACVANKWWLPTSETWAELESSDKNIRKDNMENDLDLRDWQDWSAFVKHRWRESKLRKRSLLSDLCRINFTETNLLKIVPKSWSVLKAWKNSWFFKHSTLRNSFYCWLSPDKDCCSRLTSQANRDLGGVNLLWRRFWSLKAWKSICTTIVLKS